MLVQDEYKLVVLGELNKITSVRVIDDVYRTFSVSGESENYMKVIYFCTEKYYMLKTYYSYTRAFTST